MHAEGDLRPLPIAAEKVLPDQDAAQKALLESRQAEPSRRCFTWNLLAATDILERGRATMGAEIPDLSESEFRGRLAGAYSGDLPAEAVARLHAHYRELRRWNRRVALVGRGVANAVVERLFGESLAALRLIDPSVRLVLDVGSGAGFPGLVIAAARPDLRVILVEPRRKKWAFLRAAAERSSLSCECLNARVSAALPSSIPESIDRVTVRALRLGAAEMEALSARLGPEGSFLLWTGADGGPPEGYLARRAVDLGAGRGRVLEVTRMKSGEAK